jgi:hypothetical protein
VGVGVGVAIGDGVRLEEALVAGPAAEAGPPTVAPRATLPAPTRTKATAAPAAIHAFG